MKRLLIKTLILVMTIFIMFFIKNMDVFAVEECNWYSYESGIYYDSNSKTYKPLRNSGTIAYKLEFRKRVGRDFKIGILDIDKNTFSSMGSYTKFVDKDSSKKLEKASKCPEYIVFNDCNNNYSIDESTEQNYTKFIENAYKNNYSDDSYDSFTRIYLYVGKCSYRENRMVLTSKKTKYAKEVKLEKYNDDLKKTLLKKLYAYGFRDRGQEYHYKEDFYNSTEITWLKAINSMESELKKNCSDYKNPKSNNHDVYLDFLDKDIFGDLLDQNQISSYSESKYKNKIPSEACYNTVIKAQIMQISFVDWFSLVDWLALTKVDNGNGDIDKFYKFYEFAHLKTEGGTNVKNVYDSLVEMKKGNKAIDNYTTLQNDKCTALCHNYNPAYNESISNTTPYNQCLNSQLVKGCKKAVSDCEISCKNATSEGDCQRQCVSLKIGDDNYNNLMENIEVEKEMNGNNLSDAISGMNVALSRIKSPTFDIQFDKPYEIKCEDVKFAHEIYVILKIFAPIAVIVFGSLDYAKAVMASDVEKMEKVKKKFPKRIMAVLIFVFLPILISITLKLYSQSTNQNINSSLMYCVINGDDN